MLLGVGLAAFCVGAASKAEAGIVEAGELALDGVSDAFGGDRGMHEREVIAAQLRTRTRGRDGGHRSVPPEEWSQAARVAGSSRWASVRKSSMMSPVDLPTTAVGVIKTAMPPEAVGTHLRAGEGRDGRDVAQRRRAADDVLKDRPPRTDR